MELMQIGQEIHNTSKRIEEGVNRLHKYAVAYATAEKEYRIALAKEIMFLRDNKLPVTLVNDVARGNTAEQKFKRDLAEVEYKTARDMLNALQAELSGLQTLYKAQTEV
ncbi:hypothetical protein CLTEP_02440 [Clostridium tepidiprofundi DSM 19306]|uniref:Uncharacterized protein n=1 Tax=Clostridium tepidiprofundi DSM 19306 TaxID=1121338 RepID=A0A151B7C7_9CLOT|nr:hypothetical protein [Clostridium tepidiprofundi]KYH35851.1 hypothetical protein CLTEP_02440 [Clostridium tepidiprofundi DSM 19306]